MKRFIAYLCITLVLAGCIPAGVPENLDDTPGPAVVIDGREYVGEVFKAQYPDGWRIVTGEASSPQSVIFVAPDEISTIQLRVGHLEAGDFSGDRQTDIRSVTLSDGTVITAVLIAFPENFDSLLPVFAGVIETIEPSQHLK